MNMDEILIPASIYAELEECTKKEVCTTGYIFYQQGTNTIVGYYSTGAGEPEQEKHSALKEIVAESMATALGLEKIIYHTRPNSGDDFAKLQEKIMSRVGHRHMLISNRGVLSVTQDFKIKKIADDDLNIAKIADFKKKIGEFEKRAGLCA
jgi:hypothetical protein